MDNFIVELVSNASSSIYPDNTLASFTNFLPEQLYLDGDWEVALLEITYPALYNNITEGKFWYVPQRSTSKKSNNEETREALNESYETVTILPGMYLSLDEIFQSMNDALRLRNRQSVELKWKVDSITRHCEIELASDKSQLVFASQDLCSILGFSQSVWFSSKGPHRSEFPIDILRFHSVMVYTDIVEFSIIGDTKAPILRCFPFNNKIQRDSISVTKYSNYVSFDNLQFRRLLKNSIHSIKVELRSPTGELIPFVAVGITRLTLLFRKTKGSPKDSIPI